MAAQDTLPSATKSAKLKSENFLHFLPAEHSPKVAGIASAIVPGLGQAYNKKYWKVPIVYAGLATAGYFIYYNFAIYSNFRKAYLLKLDDDSTSALHSFKVWYITSTNTFYLDGYPTSNLYEVQNKYRYYLDISILVAAGIYLLNILDAVVDAHLYHFDVSNDLSLDVRPFYNPVTIRKAGGINLTFTF